MKRSDTATRPAPIFVARLFVLAGLLELPEPDDEVLVALFEEAVFVPVGIEVT